MNKTFMRIFCLILAAILCLGLLAGIIPAHAAAVSYTYASNSDYSNIIVNWGSRGVAATAMTPNAEAFYTENNVSYEQLALLSGSSSISGVPSSPLYQELQDLMQENHKVTTSYGESRYLMCYTDCQNNNYSAGISAFYSGRNVGPDWDSGSTWNREHCWPKSKTGTPSVSNSTRGEAADIMTLRPAVSNINSSRGNKAYGEGSSYYNPNSVSSGSYNLHGDVARIVLYTYVRWGNTSYMWGSGGVMENKDVLLKWMAEDPVDTWELARNDSVESITGTRNVFVDYPEFAFLLFNESIPEDMGTPSNGTGSSVVPPPVITPVAPEIVTAPVAGTAYNLFMEQKNNNAVLFFNGETESETVTYRLATTTSAAASAEVFLEAVSGGYALYFMDDGVKTYIRIYERTDGAANEGKGSLEFVKQAPAEVLTYNSDYNTLVYTADADNSYYLGTYSNYETFSVSNISYLSADKVDVSQFPARFALSSTDPDAPTPHDIEPEPEPKPDSGLSFVDVPVAGKAYKLGMQQNKLDTPALLTFTGVMSGFYYGTSDDASQAVDVYLEEAAGGYHLYFLDDGTKTYLDVIQREGYTDKVTVVLATSGNHTVYTLNTQYKYLQTNLLDIDWYLGTFNKNTTISASNISYIEDTSLIGVSQFCAWFLEEGEQEPPIDTSKNGWILENGEWYYYQKGIALKNAWMQDSKGWCFLGADGAMETNTFVRDSKGMAYVDAGGYYYEINGWKQVDGVWYYLEKGYRVQSAWRKDSKGWCYLGEDGAMIVESWIKDSIGWCYVDKSGYMVYGKWIKDSIGWRYAGTNGYMITNQWVKDYYGWCYVGEDGYMLTNAWSKDSKGWCWIGESGYIVYDQWVTDSGNKYYIDKAGYRVTGEQTIDGTTYYFDENGVCQAGYTVIFKNDDGTVLSSKLYPEGATVQVPADPTKADDAQYTYTFAGWDKPIAPVTGDAVYTATYTKTERPVKNGWILEGGKWHYYQNDAMVKSKWVKDSIGWCYLDAKGEMVYSSWVKDYKGWCYVDGSGYMVYNQWVKDSVGWCFVGEDGYMVYNDLVIDLVNGKIYYIDPNGYMVSNRWIGEGNEWVYFGSDGAAVINDWVYSGGKWYYMDENGLMLYSCSATIGGKTYNFNASGVCTNP